MRRIASLSLDLDNQWSYMKTHGDAGWESFPSYLDLVVPRMLTFLKARNMTITFFVVGQDAALEKNREALLSVREAGHEIANHSFNHEPWLHLYSRQELENEFEKTEDALESITGIRPVGFRGPGFSLNSTVLDVLTERNYEYDCSTLPTYIAPLARAFYFLKSPRITVEEREKLKRLFGKAADGLQTLRPHFVRGDLVEIPVTTFPGVKTPVHASYLMYLSTFSPALARAYWRMAVAACRATGVEPSFLLHPLDFLGGEDVAELKFFPGMNVSSERKIELLGYAVDLLGAHFDVRSMREHADSFRRQRQADPAKMHLKNA